MKKSSLKTTCLVTSIFSRFGLRFWRFGEPLGPQKTPPGASSGQVRFRTPFGPPKSRKYASRPRRECFKKTDYHGTGSAFGARAASKASEARARRSQQTLQAETKKKHQEEQELPRARQQEHRDSEPGHSTEASRRRYAPPPRRFELGALREFPCGLRRRTPRALRDSFC